MFHQLVEDAAAPEGGGSAAAPIEHEYELECYPGRCFNVFTQQNTSRMLGSFEVKATWFQSVNAGLIFILDQRESARWLRFTPMKSSLLYHSDQGWGWFNDFAIGGRDFRVTPIFAVD